MSGAVEKLAKTTFKALTLGAFDQPEVPTVEVAEAETPFTLTETEQANIAQEEAKRKAKKAKSGTQTILTSPLGATGAATAKPKLGGS